MGLLSPKQNVQADLEQIRADFKAQLNIMSNTLLNEIRQSKQQSDMVTLPKYQVTNLYDISQKLDKLIKQNEELLKAIAQISTMKPNGEQKAIHEVIEAHTQKIAAAIQGIHADHAQWIEERQKEMAQAGQALTTLSEIVEQSRKNIAPKTEQRQQSTEPIKQIS